MERASSRALVMAVRYEPASLASKPLRASGSGVSSTTRLFNAELDLEDGRPGPAVPGGGPAAAQHRQLAGAPRRSAGGTYRRNTFGHTREPV